MTPDADTQLNKIIRELAKRPGLVSLQNIKRIAELFGLYSITDDSTNINFERLTIGGPILLIDIDFDSSTLKASKVSLSLVSETSDLQGDSLMDTDVQINANQNASKEDNVNMDAKDDQKPIFLRIKGQFDSLKRQLSFTNKSIENSADKVLLNSLTVTGLPKKPINKQNIQYDIIKLNNFVSNLKYLTKLDKLSVIKPNDTPTSTTASNLNSTSNSELDDQQNVDLFNYIDELSMVFYIIHQNEYIYYLNQLNSSTSYINSDPWEEKALDLINGYSNFGKPEINVNNKIGLFMKYWEDNRYINRKSFKIENQYLKTPENNNKTNDDKNDLDSEMMNINEELPNNNLDIFQSETYNTKFHKDIKYIQFSVKADVKNSLLPLDTVLTSSYLDSVTNSLRNIQLKTINQSQNSQNTIINFIDHNIAKYFVTPINNSNLKTCLNLKFFPNVWIPIDLFLSYFNSSNRSYKIEIKFKESTKINKQKSKFEEEEFLDLNDLIRKTNKRNNTDELYINNYNDLVNLQEGKAKKSLVSEVPLVDDIFSNFNSQVQKQYVINVKNPEAFNGITMENLDDAVLIEEDEEDESKNNGFNNVLDNNSKNVSNSTHSANTQTNSNTVDVKYSFINNSLSKLKKIRSIDIIYKEFDNPESNSLNQPFLTTKVDDFLKNFQDFLVDIRSWLFIENLIKSLAEKSHCCQDDDNSNSKANDILNIPTQTEEPLHVFRKKNLETDASGLSFERRRGSITSNGIINNPREIINRSRSSSTASHSYTNSNLNYKGLYNDKGSIDLEVFLDLFADVDVSSNSNNNSNGNIISSHENEFGINNMNMNMNSNEQHPSSSFVHKRRNSLIKLKKTLNSNHYHNQSLKFFQNNYFIKFLLLDSSIDELSLGLEYNLTGSELNTSGNIYEFTMITNLNIFPDRSSLNSLNMNMNMNIGIGMNMGMNMGMSSNSGSSNSDNNSNDKNNNDGYNSLFGGKTNIFQNLNKIKLFINNGKVIKVDMYEGKDKIFTDNGIIKKGDIIENSNGNNINYSNSNNKRLKSKKIVKLMEAINRTENIYYVLDWLLSSN
ncbi:uncharacterized protein ASCRUDRAFT_6759 [Ascoidea rubescens DSM 1968]|uniref:Mediator of RNA polymerase II transcription subunit 1 n=1 Tax=Ascoidea rubescens DSM 1968 TaxID=1344418 RepID=A0A1D2VNL3_9ASCO|nr:hypothetical protein ASCRUDRAFT_6759 [Ascoidea rubescens DSM 1968]ODV63198.1 hypothetical protein ASCRUDRAFT_6759 [Ascoidea rubescens DSM 1968]